jgi:hypothetical protein
MKVSTYLFDFRFRKINPARIANWECTFNYFCKSTGKPAQQAAALPQGEVGRRARHTYPMSQSKPSASHGAVAAARLSVSSLEDPKKQLQERKQPQTSGRTRNKQRGLASSKRRHP